MRNSEQRLRITTRESMDVGTVGMGTVPEHGMNGDAAYRWNTSVKDAGGRSEGRSGHLVIHHTRVRRVDRDGDGDGLRHRRKGAVGAAHLGEEQVAAEERVVAVVAVLAELHVALGHRVRRRRALVRGAAARCAPRVAEDGGRRAVRGGGHAVVGHAQGQDLEVVLLHLPPVHDHVAQLVPAHKAALVERVLGHAVNEVGAARIEQRGERDVPAHAHRVRVPEGVAHLALHLHGRERAPHEPQEDEALPVDLEAAERHPRRVGQLDVGLVDGEVRRDLEDHGVIGLHGVDHLAHVEPELLLLALLLVVERRLRAAAAEIQRAIGCAHRRRPGGARGGVGGREEVLSVLPDVHAAADRLGGRR
mmetsp:Transcript_27543/g.92086  ORF Transcript_27543/g.92086 Transcript_27543/m.92086 type:complete len:362 (+) Transcript_27543:145-1230(+)